MILNKRYGKVTTGMGRQYYQLPDGEVAIGDWDFTGEFSVDHHSGRVVEGVIIQQQHYWLLPNYVVGVREPDAVLHS